MPQLPHLVRADVTPWHFAPASQRLHLRAFDVLRPRWQGAAFIKAGMPCGDAGLLRNQQAREEASLVNSHPRQKEPGYIGKDETTRRPYQAPDIYCGQAVHARLPGATSPECSRP